MTQNLHEHTPRRARRTADGHLAGPLARAILDQGADATVIEPGTGARVVPGGDRDAGAANAGLGGAPRGTGGIRVGGIAPGALELRTPAASSDKAASRKSYIISGVLLVIALAVWLWPTPAAQPSATQTAGGGSVAMGEDAHIGAGEVAVDGAGIDGSVATVEPQAAATAATRRRAQLRAHARSRRVRQRRDTSKVARHAATSSTSAATTGVQRTSPAPHHGRPAISDASSSGHAASTVVSLNPVT